MWEHVEALKQVGAGTSFIQKTLEAFQVRSVKTTVLVDMYGYDAWPALACLKDAELLLKSIIFCWQRKLLQ